jgi:hypothetical protein
MVGSHLDLTPTLVELAAPVGFTYHTLGKDLLEPRSCPVGVGKGLVIGSSFFLDINANPRIHLVPGTIPPVTPIDITHLKRLHDSLHGIAWWRVMHGPKIDPAQKN